MDGRDGRAQARVQARTLLQDAVAQEASRFLVVAAAVAFTFSVVNALHFELGAVANGLHLLAVAVLVVGSALVRRVAHPFAPWIVAAGGLALTTTLLLEVRADPSAVGMGYVVLLMAASGPFILETVPVLVSYVVQLAIAVPVLASVDDPSGWGLLLLAAAVVGSVIAKARAEALVRAGRAVAMLAERADHDELTRALNRRGLERRWPALVAAAARRDEQVIAVFIDIDGFKQVNDRLGHHRGDAVITSVAAAIHDSVRAEDLVSRWGGDEFLVVGSGAVPGARDLAARISEEVAAAAGVLGDGHVGVSTGAAVTAANADAFDDLVRAADHDMYDRRAERRGRVRPQ